MQITVIEAITIIWNDNSFQSTLICISLSLLTTLLLLAFASRITTDSPTLIDKIITTVSFTIFIWLMINFTSPAIKNYAEKIQNTQKIEIKKDTNKNK